MASLLALQIILLKTENIINSIKNILEPNTQSAAYSQLTLCSSNYILPISSEKATIFIHLLLTSLDLFAFPFAQMHWSAKCGKGNCGQFKNTKCIITLGVSMRMSWALASREKGGKGKIVK